jgi:hypothetical protein
MIQFIPVTYFKNDVDELTCVKFDSEKHSTKIQVYIHCCFFEFGVNSLVVKFKEELFILEPDTTAETGYTRTKIQYHPFQHLFE